MGEPAEIIQKVDEFVTSLDDLISKKASDEALTRVFDSNNEDLVRMASLDILNMVGPRLRDRNCEEGDIDEWYNLQSMLEYVVTVSSPKEMLIGLLSLLEIAQSDEFFKLILQPLRGTFLRLPSQRGDTLLWALNGLHDYIGKIPLPAYLVDLEENEKAILENSKELNRLESCVTSAMNFCELFASEAKECKLIASTDRRQEQILSISSFLLKLVERPVAYFEWDRRITFKTEPRKQMNKYRYECAQRLVRMLFDLKENFLFAGIEWHEMGRLSLICRFTEEDENDNASKKVSAVAFGVLAALIYCQGMCLDRVPQVYSPDYIFERLLPYANSILKQDAPVVDLGVDFLGLMSQRLLLQSNRALGAKIFWSSKRLNMTTYQELFLNLVAVMTYAKAKRTRTLALGVFSRYFGFFDANGQMLIIRLIYYVFEQSESDGDESNGEKKSEWFFANKGICGYLIDQYRSYLNRELCRSNIESPYFENITRMLALFTSLPRREETDFLDNYEQYMAALNLIRFLCMIRLNGRYTSLPSAVFNRVSKDFVEPMRKGLELSKAHYELDLKNCHNDQCAKLQSVISNGAQFDCIAIDAQKADVLKSAINSYDMMMSLVVRVSELLESCLKVE